MKNTQQNTQIPSSVQNFNVYGVAVLEFDSNETATDMFAHLRRGFANSGQPAANSFTHQSGSDVYTYDFEIAANKPVKWFVTKNSHRFQEAKNQPNGGYIVNSFNNGILYKSEYYSQNHTWQKTVFSTMLNGKQTLSVIQPYQIDNETAVLKFIETNAKPLVYRQCNQPTSSESYEKLIKNPPPADVIVFTDKGFSYFAIEEKRVQFDFELDKIEAEINYNMRRQQEIDNFKIDNGFNINSSDFNASKLKNNYYKIQDAGYVKEPPVSTQPIYNTEPEVTEYTPSTEIPSAPVDYTPSAEIPSAPVDYTPSAEIPSAPIGYTPSAEIPSAPIGYAPSAEIPSAPIGYTPSSDVPNVSYHDIQNPVSDFSNNIPQNYDSPAFTVTKSVADFTNSDYASANETQNQQNRSFEDLNYESLQDYSPNYSKQIQFQASDYNAPSSQSSNIPEPPVTQQNYSENIPLQYNNYEPNVQDIKTEPIQSNSSEQSERGYSQDNPFTAHNILSYLTPDAQVKSGNQKYYYYGDLSPDNKRHGYGKTLTEDGRTAYDGEYKENKRDGFGVFYYKNSNFCYAGDWKDNKKDGVGLCRKDSNGELQLGKWHKDQPYGIATRITKDGEIVYIGQYKDGKRNGIGVTFDQNENPIIAVWKDDKEIQILYSTYYDNNN